MKIILGKPVEDNDECQANESETVSIDAAPCAEDAPAAQAEESVVLGESSPGAGKEILFEDVSKRDARTKHYRMSDGTYEAVIFNEDLHYYDEAEGKYCSIDNSFEQGEAEGGVPCFENKSNEFKVRLSQNVNSPQLLLFGFSSRLATSAITA